MTQFFIVGAQRCGTTYLYSILDQHPQICMARPVRPEPKYFLSDHDVFDEHEYRESFYSGCGDAICFGEKSTSYYEHRDAALRIQSAFPQAKIIFMLRDPVYRAISNYFFSVQSGIETRSIGDAIFNRSAAPSLNQSVSTDPFNYLGRGNYEKYIREFIEIFSDVNVDVLVFEQFAGNREEIGALYQFLGVDPGFMNANIDARVNASERNSDVPVRVEEELREYYRGTIGGLEKLIQKDLAVWSGRLNRFLTDPCLS